MSDTRWYIAEDGKVHHLSNRPTGSYRVIDHGTWQEVWILAPEKGDQDREVLGEYDLHSRPFQVVAAEHGLPGSMGGAQIKGPQA